MTIQKRLWISNLILIIITILLLIVVSLIITEYFQGFIGLPTQDNYRNPLNRGLFRAERLINKAIDTDQDQFLEQEYLKQIDDFLNSSNIGLIVQKEDEVIFLSPFVNSMEIDINELVIDNQQISTKPEDIKQLSDILFVKVIPFHFSDQSLGSIYLVNDITSVHQELEQFKYSVIYTLIIFLIVLIVINTLITFLLSKQIVRPLTRLIDATEKIKKGNYDFTLKNYSKDEIGVLFQSFEAARKQLKKSEETKRKYEENRNELITNISHDLKTPITTIKGYVEGIIDGIPQSKEKQDKYLQIIHQNAVHMESLIKDLFLLSKFDLDQSYYQFENINIKGYLRDSHEELRSDLQEKGIRLEFKSEYNQNELVRADRQQLKRVIFNLINNAISFKNDTEPIIYIILTEASKEAKIEIKDNGKGIPLEILDKIFDRFYKGDKSRSEATPGTGLGLYISKKIISDHGGRIWATSKPGQSTSIFFTLKKVFKNND